MGVVKRYKVGGLNPSRGSGGAQYAGTIIQSLCEGAVPTVGRSSAVSLRDRWPTESNRDRLDLKRMDVEYHLVLLDFQLLAFVLQEVCIVGIA